MRRGLADSLRYLCRCCCQRVAFDEAAVQRLACGLDEGERYPASTFGIYYELVPAITVGDREAVERLFAELVRESPVDGLCRIVGLGDAVMRDQRERYVRLLDTDPGQPFGFEPPSPELARDFAARLRRGRDLLKRVAPDLAAEHEQILSEIVLAVGDGQSEYTFDGGSSYMLWGALFLNAESHTTDVAMVDVLAHEAAHSLLFGLSTQEPLVNNPDDELYASPLRRDPRPMDGIYHATFVSARMHWTLSQLLAHGSLNAEQVRDAEARREISRGNFEAGVDVVAEHASLTATGRVIIEAAQSYMAGID